MPSLRLFLFSSLLAAVLSVFVVAAAADIVSVDDNDELEIGVVVSVLGRDASAWHSFERESHKVR